MLKKNEGGRRECVVKDPEAMFLAENEREHKLVEW